uniref:C2H2-type domain-containing protein n=1 Tax=Panagrolaimus sp. ES5 TaxID=591445 RepID=A0AC34GSG0_9BILA
MSSAMKRERSQDSVVLLSDTDDEEKSLKIHYQDSPKFFEVPLEDDGRLLFEDVTSIDSKVIALILQEDGNRKLVKPKNGYIKEPKEKWTKFKVYASLKKESEIVLKNTVANENLNPNVSAALNWNITVKQEDPTVLAEVLQNDNNTQIKTKDSKLSTSLLPKNNLKSHQSSTSCLASKISNNNDANSTQVLSPPPINETASGGSESTTDSGESSSDENESANSIIAGNEPYVSELMLAYKVSSFKALKFLLYRGNFEYNITCNAVIRRFKRTMIAFPNNEIVRIIHYAQSSDILLKDLNLTSKYYCQLCEENFTLKHLVSDRHAEKFHQKFNADPPEIARLLEPKIYKQFIDPLLLASLRISKYKKMEESSMFSIKNSPENADLVKLKYILINRILQANLKMSYSNSFSIEKLLFLQENRNQILSIVFTIQNYYCQNCKFFPNSFPNSVSHIFSEIHIEHCLNQDELDEILNTMSNLEQTSKGCRFLPFKESRKRNHPSNGVQESGKRHKKA